MQPATAVMASVRLQHTSRSGVTKDLSRSGSSREHYGETQYGCCADGSSLLKENSQNHPKDL